MHERNNRLLRVATALGVITLVVMLISVAGCNAVAGFGVDLTNAANWVQGPDAAIMEARR